MGRILILMCEWAEVGHSLRRRPHFPSIGHLFRIGALTHNATQFFSRMVLADFILELPLCNPCIAERQDDRIRRDHLRAKWVLNGVSAYLNKGGLQSTDEQMFAINSVRVFMNREP